MGLLFLYAAQAEQFKEADEPAWVTSWLSKREEKAEKKEQKAKSDTPVDEAAQAKRQAMRHQKVLNGIDELEIWLKDLLRNGLINIPERAYTLFDGIARRMVDAQAPGLANRLKAIQEINFYEESWKLPAGTGTFECYVFCIDYGLVWSFPASLAMSPDSTVTVFQQHPLGSCREPSSGFYGGCIRG